MVSRLLNALDARIARTRDPVQADCLRAERATLLARQGHLEQAHTQLEQIRARHAARPNAVVTAWVCLGEGMVSFYGNLAPSSRDKFLRAHALAAACNSAQVERLAAAWLAHFEYLEQDFDSVASLVERVLSTCPQDEHLVLERASLVLAQTYHWADQFELARPWYERARWHANILGDEVLISALMHNMAWLHVVNERHHALFDVANNVRAAHLLVGTQSSEAFDKLIGIVSLTSLGPILQAHALSLAGRFEEALALFESNLVAGIGEGLSRIECSVLAEFAWCCANVRERSTTMQAVAMAQSKLGECDQPDELAAAHGRLAQCLQSLGELELSDVHAARSTEQWLRHRALQDSALVSLVRSATLAIPIPIGAAVRTESSE